MNEVIDGNEEILRGFGRAWFVGIVATETDQWRPRTTADAAFEGLAKAAGETEVRTFGRKVGKEEGLDARELLELGSTDRKSQVCHSLALFGWKEGVGRKWYDIQMNKRFGGWVAVADSEATRGSSKR
jgi:hypothetical protein